MIKINDIDVTRWVYNIDQIPIYERNLDFSQIYSEIKFRITQECPYLNKIGEDSIVHVIYPDSETRIMYKGYIEVIERGDYYS